MAFFKKPQYATIITKRKDIPRDLYTRCPLSGKIVYHKDLKKNLMVVPNSGYHFPMTAQVRINSLIDDGTWMEYDEKLRSVDPLVFKGKAAYLQKLEENRKKTGMEEAVICGIGGIMGIKLSLAVTDFRFLAGSMGSVVGEKITRAIERATSQDLPVVIISSSGGGARMYEGVLSLMQMAKTSAALARHREAGLPYISVMANPTFGGVTASFATLGDINLAEPGALIGFAGPRVIKEGTGEELPKDFQTAEFLLQRGLIDQIVSRLDLRERLVSFLKVFLSGRLPGKPTEEKS